MSHRIPLIQGTSPAVSLEWGLLKNSDRKELGDQPTFTEIRRPLSAAQPTLLSPNALFVFSSSFRIPSFRKVFPGEPAREVCFVRRFPARPFSQHHCMKCNDERGKRTSASSLYLHLCAPAGAAAAGRTFNERALMP